MRTETGLSEAGPSSPTMTAPHSVGRFGATICAPASVHGRFSKEKMVRGKAVPCGHKLRVFRLLSVTWNLKINIWIAQERGEAGVRSILITFDRRAALVTPYPIDV
mmetsp:Transcript_37355/g.111928  ORF Transcript_37355/g.111928 Transcript_37355/m.111928 type:complete len:106 (+) Transcript_37355:958-1275(+)